MSSADQTVLRYIAEVTLGTTPATPALKQIRYTGESVNWNIENIQSEEIRPDRVESDLIQVAADGAGSVDFELSYGSHDDFLAAALAGAWAANILKNGSTVQGFSLQKHFSDLTPNIYHTFKGIVVDGWSLEMEVGAIVTGAFELLAMDMATATAQIAGATFPAVSTTTPMNAVVNVQDFMIDGVPYTGCISTLSIETKNNYRAIKCIGQLMARDMKLGTLEVTGNMNFYFNDGSVYDLFRNGTEFSFTFGIEDAAGNRYDILVPRAKFESGEVVAGGKNSDVMFNASWRGLYDTTETCVIKITRTPAP